MGSVDESPNVENHDIIIIGAGISGINTAHVVRSRLPHRSLTILEKRHILGGTWNLFRYPGFRSDSYLQSFGLGWFPWTKKHKIGEGDEILNYLNDAAEHDGIKPLIRFRHKVCNFEWTSASQKWRVDVEVAGVRKVYLANFIIGCTGYYADDRALEARIPGIDSFPGPVVHTQWWPEDLDYTGKRVIIIGSGATTITVFPELAKKASHVTMLQRSPSYVVERSYQPPVDWLFHLLLPMSWACALSRWFEITLEVVLSTIVMATPAISRKLLVAQAKKQLPKKVDGDIHFTPRYDPMEQRLGMCPEGNFFKALHQDNCEIVTDTIETVTPKGITLNSGKSLDADIIVTATGLYFQLFDGMKPVVDGTTIEAGQRYAWRGMMMDGLPNASFIFGHTTTSWTPGANMMAHLTVKLLKSMERKGATTVVPRIKREEGMPRHLAVEVKSNYFLTAADRIPKVTNKGPWYGRLSLPTDIWAYLFGSMDDGLVYGGFKDKNA